MKELLVHVYEKDVEEPPCFISPDEYDGYQEIVRVQRARCSKREIEERIRDGSYYDDEY